MKSVTGICICRVTSANKQVNIKIHFLLPFLLITRKSGLHYIFHLSEGTLVHTCGDVMNIAGFDILYTSQL
jgi:hypothetical protein